MPKGMPGPTDFQLVFETDAEATLLIDETAQVVAVSAGYLRATGLARSAVLEHSLFDLPPYREQPVLKQRLQEALDGIRQSVLMHSVALEGAAGTDSRPPWAWDNARPLPSPDGSVRFTVHSFRGATTGTPSESQRERRLRKLIEHSYDVIALFDGMGRVQFVSPSVRRILGYSEEQFVALPPLELVHPDDAAQFGRKINELYGQPGGFLVQRVRTRHADGSWRTNEVASWNLLHDPDVAAVVSNFRDITPHVELAAALERKNEHLQLTLTAARAITWDVDVRQRKVTYFPDFHAFFHMPPGPTGPILGLDALEAIHPDDRDNVRKLALESIASGRELNLEFRGRDVEGEPRWYAVNGRLITDAAGHPVRLVGVVWDATERHLLEAERTALERQVQESQKLESLGVLAGGLAHDFNNLLTTILGSTGMLQRAAPGAADMQRQLAQVEEAALHAADLCQQMLAYAGKGRFVLGRVDINQLIQATAKLLRSSIDRRISLRFELAADLRQVVADATQIRQVLMNLVINAADAIGDAGGMIEVRTGIERVPSGSTRSELATGSELAPGSYAFLQVIDSGPGMTKEVQARIFEPFFSTKFTGRGLGLATVLGIARGHRGGLEVQSEIGQGASFKLLLPLPPDMETFEELPQVREVREPNGAPHATVLVVDDEARVRNVICQGLELMGFDVIAAESGRAALQLYGERGREIACVLMDLTMPEIDGAHALDALLRIDPKVRVLLMSGYNEHEAVARVVGKGLAGFIQKPFAFEELQQRLRALLR